MKKIISLLLIAVCLFSFSACAPKKAPEDRVPSINYNIPNNGIFSAPNEFKLEWDIPSVRSSTIEKSGFYSIPVYRFDTREEFVHLKEIVGQNYIGGEQYPNIFYEGTAYEEGTYCEYGEWFFEEHSLLIGWCEGYNIDLYPEGYHNNGVTPYAPYAYYDSTDNTLTVEIHDNYRSENTCAYWIFVAVPKADLEKCDNIAFLVEIPEYYY